MWSHSPLNLRGFQSSRPAGDEKLRRNSRQHGGLSETLQRTRRSFDGCELNYITRANNTEADELANIGSTRGPIPPGVFLESISQRSIKTPAAATEAVAESEDATDPTQVASANP